MTECDKQREKKKEVEEKDWHRVERSQAKFMRQFRLPENANADEVKAVMENGILTVTVRKVETLKMDIKSIEILGYFSGFLSFPVNYVSFSLVF
ncbi:hypothetical protein AMTRI_Chr01g104160 [Amborella trichopoda]